MSETELPPHWRSAKDADGKEYYFNELTGETSWKVPGSEDAATKKPTTPSAVVAADASEFAPAAEAPIQIVPAKIGGGKRTGPAFGGVSGTLGDGVFPRILIIIFCSLVVLISSSAAVGRKDTANALAGVAVMNGAAEEFGVAVGTISLIFCCFIVLFAKYKPDKFSNWTLPKVKGEWSMLQCFTAFLVVWWGAGAAVLTFFSPFTSTSNAYFAVWAAFAASVLMCTSAFQRASSAFGRASSLREDANVKSLVGLALASAVVLFSCIEYVGLGDGKATFGLIVGCTSTLLATILYYLVDRKKAGIPLKKLFAALFVVLWIASAVVLTFDGPFGVTGNGYFATWLALIFAFSFAYQEFVGGELPLTSGLRSSFSFTPMDDGGSAHNAMGSGNGGGISTVSNVTDISPAGNAA